MMINLLPMAGKGNRFFIEKYNLPKPFIPIFGKEMFISSVTSFPRADQYIFLCLQSHNQKYGVDKIAASYFPGSRVVEVDKPTEGQACTCLLAEPYLTDDAALFIASCDYQTIYDANRYKSLLNDASIDAVIWTFKTGNIKKANPNDFAYCRTEGNQVLEVVEKRTISKAPEKDHAVVGSFTFKRAELFKHAVNKMISKNIRVNNEFYVGTSINQLIEEGRKVVIFEVDKFVSFGNPFELSLFYYWQDYFDRLEDHPFHIDDKFKSPPR